MQGTVEHVRTVGRHTVYVERREATRIMDGRPHAHGRYHPGDDTWVVRAIVQRPRTRSARKRDGFKVGEMSCLDDAVRFCASLDETLLKVLVSR